jgi:ABC-2 type transport system ATP-binding protein
LLISVVGAPRLVPGILDDLRSARVPVAAIEVTRPTLDDVFLTLTGRSLREGGATPESADDIELVEV